ncbi:hypothetical protein SUGI_0411140 [Cryptomeria japonica]|uniref:F-box protein SKIP16 n=1 Tax=Cryptomeria japonica TaxID=3369 RepID=UPI002408AC3B|nr:F-box protein SKIP16 [Cryptomeria japonica]GLJ21951.1 hypothetical protein SUGI_0411140 [Cryptomeria japonica]
MEELPGSIVRIIVVKTDAKVTATLGCVSKQWRCVASDDLLWSRFCSQDFAVSTAVDPLGNPCSSFKETYEKWYAAFDMYPSSIVKRAKQCWDTIKNWTSIHFPEVADTLAPGANEEQINKVEEDLGFQLPVPMRVLYRFCNGQNTLKHHFPQNEQLASLGLLGGYEFYEYKANVHLLPLQYILQLTKHPVPYLKLPIGSEYVVVAVSSYRPKFFYLNCSDGQLYVGNGMEQKQLVLRVPNLLDNMDQKDAMLLWLEEYGRMLQDGMFSVHKDDNIRSISLFPEKEPLCTKAVTDGVQVCGSAVFVPEYEDFRRNEDKYMFSYSVRMRLLHQEKISQKRILSSCQLSRRHWIIRANNNVIDDVAGEGVIGKYPLLQEGGDEFVYESCSYLPTSSGSIEGYFTFVPGRLSKPDGPEFTVRVAPIPLQIPQYIF